MEKEKQELLGLISGLKRIYDGGAFANIYNDALDNAYHAIEHYFINQKDENTKSNSDANIVTYNNLKEQIPNELDDILVRVDGKEICGYYSNRNKCLMVLDRTELTNRGGVRSSWCYTDSVLWRPKEPITINIDAVHQLKQKIDDINSIDFKNINFVDSEGNLLKLKHEDMVDFKISGLNNIDLMIRMSNK